MQRPRTNIFFLTLLLPILLASFAYSASAQTCTNPSSTQGYALPCPVFSLSAASVSQSQSLTLSATPQPGTDYIYTTAYIYNGTAWTPFTLSGNNAYPSYSSALASLTLSSTQLSSLSLGTHYAVVWDWLWDTQAQCYKGPGLNQCNTGQWRLQTFSITTSATPGTVNDLKVVSQNTTSVTLSFTQVDDGTGHPAAYAIRYNTPTIAWGSAPEVTQRTCAVPLLGTQIGSALTCTASGLNPGTPYQFQLVSFRGTLNVDAVFGGWSNVVTAQTAFVSATPTPTPTPNPNPTPSSSPTPTPTPTGNLLTGKTPANYTLLSGWSVLCTQDFENGNPASCETGVAIPSTTMVLSTSYAHPGTGTHSLRSATAFGGPGGREAFGGIFVPSGHSEVYLSWYERLDSFTNGIGFYKSGADFYHANFWPASGGQVTLNSCCMSPNAQTPTGVFGFATEPLGLQPQGVHGDTVHWLSYSHNAHFDGAWHQWEVHYKPSSGGALNTDGSISVWIDGSLVGPPQTGNLNGTSSMNGMKLQISGWNGSIIWLKNIPDWTQCKNIASYQPNVCGAHIGDGTGCDTTQLTPAWSDNQVNSACPGQAAPHTFYKYIDDVIMLYK